MFDEYTEKRTLGYSKSGVIPQGLLGVMQRHNTDTLKPDFAVLLALQLRTFAVNVKVLDLKKCK